MGGGRALLREGPAKQRPSDGSIPVYSRKSHEAGVADTGNRTGGKGGPQKSVHAGFGGHRQDSGLSWE